MGNANPYAATISHAELQADPTGIALNANINYALSDKAKTALANGVPLFWELQIRLKQPRRWLWDETLFEKQQRFRIEYHALLNMYRFCDQDTGNSENFSTLAGAMASMSNIRKLKLTRSNPDGLALPADAYVELKMAFDSNALPLPLRPIAAIDPQWDLSSPWTLWPLTK
ncbi:hypothetical protein JCM14076_21450 [Methylosoma difficile]